MNERDLFDRVTRGRWDWLCNELCLQAAIAFAERHTKLPQELRAQWHATQYMDMHSAGLVNRQWVGRWMDLNGLEDKLRMLGEEGWSSFAREWCGLPPLVERLPLGRSLLALGVPQWTPKTLQPPARHHFTVDDGTSGCRRTYWILAGEHPHHGLEPMNVEDQHWLRLHHGDAARTYNYCRRMTPVRP